MSISSVKPYSKPPKRAGCMRRKSPASRSIWVVSADTRRASSTERARARKAGISARARPTSSSIATFSAIWLMFLTV